jgi:hypothetical protein
MPYNVPPRTPAARVGHALVGRGASDLKWKCQRRGCTKLIPRADFACPPDLAALSEGQRLAVAVVLRNYPIGHRMVTEAVRALDRTWDGARRVR